MKILLLIALAFAASLAGAPAAMAEDPIIIAHRGASGDRPEHTLAAYELAIEQGADYIEPDLVVTKDLVLVARHENELSGTTDVASREEFEDRRRDKTVDGQLVAGWFAEDFTLAELRTLRAKERIPNIRPANARYDGLYQVPTFEEVVKLVRAKEAETGRRIGLYPELKHPTFLLQSEGIDVADLLLRDLRVLGITPDDPIYIQSFDIAPLGRLDRRNDFKLIQLIRPSGGPMDEQGLTYAGMIAPSGLAEVATFADGIGVPIRLVLNDDGSPTSLVADAKAAGLLVHTWTLRRENTFMPPALRSNDDPSGLGGLPPLMGLLVNAQVDGIFTDHPGTAVTLRANGDYAP